VAVVIASWVRKFQLALVSALWVGSARADECPAGTEARPDGSCAAKVTIECPAGTIFEQGKGCVAKVVECPAGKVLEANKCIDKPPPPPAPAPAKEERAVEPPGPPKKLQLGLRVGYALPLFNALRSAVDDSAVALSTEVVGALPIGLELGYRVVDALYLGGLVSFGPAFPKQASDGYCSPSATSCSGDHARFAFQGRFYPLRRGRIEPWLGLGFGYERLTLRVEGPAATGGTGSVATTYSGVEWFELSVGADITVLRDLTTGPFVSFALGQYGSSYVREEIGSTTITSSDNIKNPAAHGWLQLGARGTFGLL